MEKTKCCKYKIHFIRNSIFYPNLVFRKKREYFWWPNFKFMEENFGSYKVGRMVFGKGLFFNQFVYSQTLTKPKGSEKNHI